MRADVVNIYLEKQQQIILDCSSRAEQGVPSDDVVKWAKIFITFFRCREKERAKNTGAIFPGPWRWEWCVRVCWRFVFFFSIVNIDVQETVLHVSNVRVQRGATIILDGISWQIKQGEHWAILGANGSGKTSLLSVLSGYLSFTSGEIQVLGKKFGQTDWRELRKKIGLVSSSIRQLMPDSEPALLTVLSGKDAVLDVWGNGSPTDRARARKFLRQVECEYLAARPWLVLSQGERQRVLIGRALMAKPKLLILDEPCAGLDPVARENLLQFLQRLGAQKNSPTLVFVTHHIEEIMPVFSHAMILKSGRVIGKGEKHSILTSALLSHALDAKIKVAGKQGRYTAKIQSNRRFTF